MREMIQQVAHNPKIGAVIAGTTGASGWFEWLPNGNEFSTWAGGILSVVLIVTHLVKFFREQRNDRRPEKVGAE